MFDFPILRTILMGGAMVGGLSLTNQLPKFDHLHRDFNEAWALGTLTSVGRAAVLYAADNDDLLPYAPGDYAYAEAQREGRGCPAIDPTFAPDCVPVSRLIVGYGVEEKQFLSPADHVPDPKSLYTKWSDYTRYGAGTGSSYEYMWHPDLVKKSVFEFEKPGAYPLFASLYRVKVEGKEVYQVVKLSGEPGHMSFEEFRKLDNPR